MTWKTTEQHLIREANFSGASFEDPWILRNYLLTEGAARDVGLIPFTILVGDRHDYWFLDGETIDHGRIRS